MIHIQERSKFNLANFSELPKLTKIIDQLSYVNEITYDHAVHEVLANGALAASGLVTIESPEKKYEGRLSYCNNYFMLISESGEGKTPTQVYILELFERRHKLLREEYGRVMETYKDQLKDWKVAEQKSGKGQTQVKKPPIPVSPDIFMGEGTKEGIYWQLRRGKVQVKALLSDEAGEFFEGVGMQNNGNFKVMSFLNRIWCNSRVTDTKVKYEEEGGTVEIEAGVCLTINFAMQSYMFYKHIPTDSNRNIGYIARYLITKAEKLTAERHLIFSKEVLPVEELREYRVALAGTMIGNIKKCQENEGRAEQVVKRLDEKAIKLYEEIKIQLSTKQCSGGEYQSITEMAQKGNWHLLRLVLIIDWIENGHKQGYLEDVISSDLLHGAWKILKYYLTQHIEITDPENKVLNDAKDGAKKVIKWLKESKLSPNRYVGWRDFMLKCSAIKHASNKDTRDEIMKELVELKHIEDHRKTDKYTPPPREVDIVENNKTVTRLLKSYIKILPAPIVIPNFGPMRLDPNDPHAINIPFDEVRP